MIVVDVGCATYPAFPEDESTIRLIERFRPSVYYGFDPHPSVVERDRWVGPSRAIVIREAAWTYDGEIAFVTKPAVANELRSHVDAAVDAAVDAPERVRCFDLADFLFGLERYLSDGLVLKLDVEGAEYTLLPYLRARGAAALLSLLLVEWHGPPLSLDFACPVEVWT